MGRCRACILPSAVAYLPHLHRGRQFQPTIEITIQDKTGQKSASQPALRGFGSPFTPTDAINKTVMATADASLLEDNTFNHIKLTTDEEVAQMRKGAIAKGMLVAVSLLTGATGQYQAYTALSDTQISKSDSRQALIATFTEKNSMHRVTVQYQGPADPTKTFPVLFDEAMKEAVSKVVQN